MVLSGLGVSKDLNAAVATLSSLHVTAENKSVESK